MKTRKSQKFIKDLLNEATTKLEEAKKSNDRNACENHREAIGEGEWARNAADPDFGGKFSFSNKNTKGTGSIKSLWRSEERRPFYNRCVYKDKGDTYSSTADDMDARFQLLELEGTKKNRGLGEFSSEDLLTQLRKRVDAFEGSESLKEKCQITVSHIMDVVALLGKLYGSNLSEADRKKVKDVQEATRERYEVDTRPRCILPYPKENVKESWYGRVSYSKYDPVEEGEIDLSGAGRRKKKKSSRR